MPLIQDLPPCRSLARVLPAALLAPALFGALLALAAIGETWAADAKAAVRGPVQSSGQAQAETIPPADIQQKGSDSGLALPRFVSLSADKVNARTGPGSRYPIAWQYQRRGLPVEVVAEYEYWRRIRDHDGTETWVHKNLTSGKRFALVDGSVRELYKKPDPASDVLLSAEPGVQARLRKCQESWCQVEIAGTKGWMPRSFLWGVYASEALD